MAIYAHLPGRGAVTVTGDDRVAFLQGLVSNDVDRVAPDRAVHAAFLTAQGKYLHDFFIVALGDGLVLDCEADRRGDLLRRLRLYRLRSKVDLRDTGDAFAVFAGFGDGVLDSVGLPAERGAARPIGDGLVFVDSRLAALGVRFILPAETATSTLVGLGLAEGTQEDYDAMRIPLGVPDSSRDITVEKSTLMESGFDELNGISWDKGCYMGQELTARTKYRGLVKRRLVPVTADGPLPPPGTPIVRNGREVGELRGGIAGHALALMRVDALAGDSEPLTADTTTVTPHKPAWADF